MIVTTRLPSRFAKPVTILALPSLPPARPSAFWDSLSTAGKGKIENNADDQDRDRPFAVRNTPTISERLMVETTRAIVWLRSAPIPPSLSDYMLLSETWIDRRRQPHAGTRKPSNAS